MEQTTLEVTGMSCNGCEQTVVEALEGLEGVSEATADHESNEVRVEHDPALADAAAIGGAIEGAGYTVSA
ncbi:heavy metal transporter [Halostagnicola larsenii XH-48]|uniref:Heavy metal transporter n=1 Tax=Halostagnicola larsenii XH-48 TaxID=797299 RepID=W0JMI8_9EURY|nr:cation transporter [Halostagnicola larsenii]AHF99925.1 heavy metal transporter [Halostagnicola larsenii XH-48]